MVSISNRCPGHPSGKATILDEIKFGFIEPYRVAGMSEPWLNKLRETHIQLNAVGIGTILTLTEDDPYGRFHRQAGFQQHHLPIEDGEPPAIETMQQALMFIEDSLRHQQGVAVHCFEGRGRTGTILAGWLGVTEGLDATSAIHKLRHQRPCTALTQPQKAFLEVFLALRKPESVKENPSAGKARLFS